MSAENIQYFVSALIKTAVKYARNFGQDLDFTRESINTVEKILDYYHCLQNSPMDQKLSERQIDSMAMIWGAYIGEVMRREIGPDCIWVREDVFGDGDIFHIRVAGKDVRAFPLDKALKRMLNGPKEHIGPFFDFGVMMFIKEINQ